MNFVALDFETANEKRHSPCSLGLCVIENGEITEEKYWLIRPKELRFSPMNIWIHGIREGDVVDALEWDQLWPEIAPFLEGRLVIAHNAAFDISVLRQTLSLYDMTFPSFDYCCTMVMSKHFYDYLPNAKLNTVSRHLDFEFTHHHAMSDARACANILLRISEELGTTNIHTLSEKVGFKVGKVFPNSYHAAGSLGGGMTSKRETMLLLEPSTPDFSLTTGFFRDRIVAFTGPLSSMSRSEAIGLVEKCGGAYSPSVTLKTSIVVTGMKDPHTLRPDQMSTKLRRAMELIGRGQKIDFLTEEQFIALLHQA